MVTILITTNNNDRHINGVVSNNKQIQYLWFWRDEAALLTRPGLIRPGLCSPKDVPQLAFTPYYVLCLCLSLLSLSLLLLF